MECCDCHASIQYRVQEVAGSVKRLPDWLRISRHDCKQSSHITELGRECLTSISIAALGCER